MATAFTRTMRSLEAESSRRGVWAACGAAALLGGWLLWSVAVPVSLYETTSLARLESDKSASPVQAPLAGKVTESRLIVGQEVAEGDLLLQLDASSQTLELTEQRAAVTALELEIAGLKSQVE